LEKDRLHETIREVFERSEETNGTSLAADFIIGGGFAGLLGQLPAIFALDGAENALHKTQGPRKGFGPGKAGSQTSMQQPQGVLPGHNIRQGRQPSEWSGILRRLHLFFSFW